MIGAPSFCGVYRVRHLTLLRRFGRSCDRPRFRIDPESVPVPYEAVLGQQFFHLLQPRLLGCVEFQIFRHWNTPHKQRAIGDARHDVLGRLVRFLGASGAMCSHMCLGARRALNTLRDYIGKDDDVDRMKFNLCSGLGMPAIASFESGRRTHVSASSPTKLYQSAAASKSGLRTAHRMQIPPPKDWAFHAAEPRPLTSP